MFADRLSTAIATASLNSLDQLSRTVWQEHTTGAMWGQGVRRSTRLRFCTVRVLMTDGRAVRPDMTASCLALGWDSSRVHRGTSALQAQIAIQASDQSICR
jgi:hypothetical protein